MKDYNSTYSFVLKEVDGDRTFFRTRELRNYEEAVNWIHIQDILYDIAGYSKRSLVRTSKVLSNTRRISYEITYIRKEN